MASWRLKHPGQLADGWKLSGTADSFFGRYPGTLVNTPTWATFMKGPSCIELDGNDQYVNIRDVAELNAVSQFSICFWMNQDVIDQTDYVFEKPSDASNVLRIWIRNTGDMYFITRNAEAVSSQLFDYSTAISAMSWHHVAWVFDGSQAGNANRSVVYVDGNPIALTDAGVIAATTADLAGIDATIGTAADSFDGKLYDFRIASCAYSRDEIISIIHEAVLVLA